MKVVVLRFVFLMISAVASKTLGQLQNAETDTTFLAEPVKAETCHGEPGT